MALTGIEVLTALRNGEKIGCSEWGHNRYITTKVYFGGVVGLVDEKGNAQKFDIFPLLNDKITNFKIFRTLKIIDKSEAMEILINGGTVYLKDISEVKLGENKDTLLVNNEPIKTSIIEFLCNNVYRKIV